MNQPLTPLKDGAKHRSPSKYYVCDIEAMNWIDFLTIGLYDGEIFEHFESIEKFFDALFATKEPKTVFAHFGGGYDFLFLLDYLYFSSTYEIGTIIPIGSNILCFDVFSYPTDEPMKKALIKRYGKKEGLEEYKKWREDNGTKISFRDSCRMLPFSLKSLCENFNVEHMKQDWDHTKTTGVTPELLEYLKHDCMGLWEVIKRYYEWPLIQKAGTAYTIAGQAIKVLRTFITKPIFSLDLEVDEFVREGYFGGRTEIFKPLYDGRKTKKKLKCFDVNSLYPTVMQQNDFPSAFKYWTYSYMPKELGVYEVEVDVPEDMWLPPLGTVIEVPSTNVRGNTVYSKKFAFPVGRFKGKWTTWEIEYAKSVGVKIVSIGRGAIFVNGGKIFKSYVDSLYEIRKKSPKQSVDNVMAKLLLNSCYGRTGIRTDREIVTLDRGQLGATPFMDLQSAEGRNIRLVTEPTSLKTFTNVAIACFVTSAARIFMHKIYMKCKKDIYYTDTDSLFTTKDLPRDDENLGGMKLEYEVDTACFLLPKTYAVKNLNEKIFKMVGKTGKKEESHSKVVMKGFDSKKLGSLEIDDFILALEGDMRRLKITQSAGPARFRSAVRKNKFLHLCEENTKEIRSKYDKRKIVKTKAGNYTTKPLYVEDGKVVV